tara:strand:- start:345 stop:1250 length:906 start_codon:yes stop_codon:yes gene_type:complete
LYTALIIGYGSIAQKHFRCLTKNKKIKKIYIYSRRRIKYKNSISKLKEIIKIDPDYILITTETSLHYKYLKFITKNFNNKKIFVEKPIFDSFKKINLNNNKVFVGYNLRLHPAIKYLHKLLKNKQIWFVSAKCESYLPNWRKNRNYFKTSSSFKKLGGGVLLDLSHELDYLNWFFGNLKPIYVFNKKISNLKINTDDILLLYAKNNLNTHFNISLNYFSKNESRQISIEGKNFSLFADLINNKITLFNNSKKQTILFKKNHNLSTYIEMHKSILNNKTKYICDYYQGLKIMKLIQKINFLK